MHQGDSDSSDLRTHGRMAHWLFGTVQSRRDRAPDSSAGADLAGFGTRRLRLLLCRVTADSRQRTAISPARTREGNFRVVRDSSAMPARTNHYRWGTACAYSRTGPSASNCARSLSYGRSCTERPSEGSQQSGPCWASIFSIAILTGEAAHGLTIRNRRSRKAVDPLWSDRRRSGKWPVGGG